MTTLSKRYFTLSFCYLMRINKRIFRKSVYQFVSECVAFSLRGWKLLSATLTLLEGHMMQVKGWVTRWELDFPPGFNASEGKH